MTSFPTNAIIAITYRCNSRCLTCDIWKKKPRKEVSPSLYKKLPSSLKDINLTGGEPFLRNDLPEIVRMIKKTCPYARIIINTNGLLPQKIITITQEILKIEPRVALRISLDGLNKTHDKMRGIKGAFQKALATIEGLKKTTIKDLGISFTLTNQNTDQLLKVYKFTKENNLQLSLTLATSSDIYFGKNKEGLRPKFDTKTNDCFSLLIKKYFQSQQPKDWFRGWFANSLKDYLKTQKRPFPCLAALGFFYLDPQGNLFTCHLKNWLLGNLTKQSFRQIWNSVKRKQYQKRVNLCNDCWMICTAKNSINNNLIRVIPQVLINKLKYIL